MGCVCRVFFLVLDLHQYSCYLRGPRFGKSLGLFRAQRLRQMLLQSLSDFSFDYPVFYLGSVCFIELTFAFAHRNENKNMFSIMLNL